MALNFPNIDPVFISIGPVNIYWYSLAYVVGILFGIYYAKFLAKKSGYIVPDKFFEDLTIALVIGIIIGGKIAFVLFYDLKYYLSEPLAIFSRSGFAFHGGMVGSIIAMIIVAKKYKKPYWPMVDIAACVAPVGVFLGRIANFINGELFGRITDVPWAMKFPQGENYLRHPSQLYEAFAEGVLLFIILNILFYKYKAYKRHGFITGIGMVLYGVFRAFIELFREPNHQIGFVFNYFTMGQILCALMVFGGVHLITLSQKKKS